MLEEAKSYRFVILVILHDDIVYQQIFSSFKLCFLQVCDCIMNSGAQAQAHLTGTKHRHRMDKVELGRSLLDKVGWGDCCVIYLYSPFLHPTRYIPLIFIKTHDNL